MLTGNTLRHVKERMLRLLENYKGVEARELQLVTDLQVGVMPHARPDDVRQALQGLADDGLATKRLDGLRGWVWKISADGHVAASALVLEEGEG